MNNPTIRKVNVDDLLALQAIGKVTFAQTFGADNTPEDMDKYLSESFSLEKLQAELDNPGSQFYFAELDGEVIGYLKINVGNAQTEMKLNNALEIERIYVKSAYHGKKVGQLLFAKAMEIARSKPCDRVWLGVWEENPRAIRFYEKNGFQSFDKHTFFLGKDEQTDIMMKLELN